MVGERRPASQSASLGKRPLRSAALSPERWRAHWNITGGTLTRLAGTFSPGWDYWAAGAFCLIGRGAVQPRRLMRQIRGRPTSHADRFCWEGDAPDTVVTVATNAVAHR